MKGIIFDFNRTVYDPETEQLTPGVLDLLKELREKGYKLAIVSRNDYPDTRRAFVTEIGLDPYFDVIMVVLEKNPEVYKECAEQLGVQPEECMVVDDIVYRGILMGNKLGMTTVWYKSGKFQERMPENEEEKPDYTITELESVKKILE